MNASDQHTATIFRVEEQDQQADGMLRESGFASIFRVRA
jgi:hypothetical protein